MMPAPTPVPTPAPAPEEVSAPLPMLATAGELPEDDAAWGYEFKWDGVRAVAAVRRGALTLFSRKGTEITVRYPEVARLPAALVGHEAIVDGEIVAMDGQGRPDFGALQNRMHRTGAEVRSVFSRMGGSMAEPGAVSWQFSRKGVILVPRSASEDDVMLAALDAGAEDVVDDGDEWRLTCEPQATEAVREALEAAGLTVLSAESTMVSSTTIEVTDAEEAKKILRIMDALEDHDDVQDVYSNFDIPDDILQSVEA